MTAEVTDDETGKAVIDSNGERIGTVESVNDGTAFVDPKSGLNATVTRAFGWNDDRDGYPLREQSIESITASAIHLRSNL